MPGKTQFSAVLVLTGELPYPIEGLTNCVKSILEQDFVTAEVVIADGSGKKIADSVKSALPANLKSGLKIVAGKFASRAAAFNAGLKKAAGDFILVMKSDAMAITLKKSALSVALMSFERNGKSMGMLYTDYERVQPDGSKSEVKLLDYHIARLRDMSDFGPLYIVRAEVMKKLKGMNEKYKFAELYDLRLRVSAKWKVIHLGSKVRGGLCTVYVQATAFNVFDYLLAGKDSQLEMERACTDYLKSIGAYLAPGINYRPVKYTPAEEAKFKKIIASVVIPVYQRPDFMRDAIDSVQRQTVKNIEVIVVVNGGPDDPTIDAVKEYMKGGKKFDASKPEVRLIITDVNNIGYCLNLGCQEARGKYYVQLDSDDQLTDDCVEKILKVYEEDSKIGIVVGSYEVWKKDAKTGQISRMDEIPVVTHDEWTEENGRNNLLRINGAGAPRSAPIKVIADVGWFGINDEPFSRNYGEDYGLVNRIIEKYRMGRVWEPIYKVVRHSGGTDHSIDPVTIDRNEEAKDFMRLEAIHRRQAIAAAHKAKAAKASAKKKTPAKKKAAKSGRK